MLGCMDAREAEELFAATYSRDRFPPPDEAIDPAALEAAYRRAAEAGHARAMTQVGLCVEGLTRALHESREVRDDEGDLDAAEDWYRRAVEAGDAEGAFLLGKLYAERRVDWPTAEQWYRVAAARGGRHLKQRAEEKLVQGPRGAASAIAEREYFRSRQDTARQRRFDDIARRWAEEE